jgi:hypothetical protein
MIAFPERVQDDTAGEAVLDDVCRKQRILYPKLSGQAFL